MSKLCGDPKCHASSFDDIPTFGKGKMDEYGFFEIPCNTCARKYEELTGIKSWPFNNQITKKNNLEGG